MYNSGSLTHNNIIKYTNHNSHKTRVFYNFFCFCLCKWCVILLLYLLLKWKHLCFSPICVVEFGRLWVLFYYFASTAVAAAVTVRRQHTKCKQSTHFTHTDTKHAESRSFCVYRVAGTERVVNADAKTRRSNVNCNNNNKHWLHNYDDSVFSVVICCFFIFIHI